MKKVRLTKSEKLALVINQTPNKFESRLIKSFVNKKDFSKFELSPLQRGINQSHVCKLMDSFKKYGTASTSVTIIKTSAFGKIDQHIIGDGQHTIHSAKALGLGVNGHIVELIEDTQDNILCYIAILNNARVGWVNKVYLSEYSKLDNEKAKRYQLFGELIKEHKLTVTDLSYIFLGGGSKMEVDMFKNGEIEFANERESMRLLKAVLKVKGYLPNKSFARRSLYKVMRMSNNYDKFADKIISSYMIFSENEGELFAQLVSINKNSALVNA